MTGRDDMVCNIEGVTILSGKSFEMLGLPVIQSVFGLPTQKESHSTRVALYNIKWDYFGTPATRKSDSHCKIKEMLSFT